MTSKNYLKIRNILNIKHGYAFKSSNFCNEGRYIVLTPGNFYESGGFRLQENKKIFHDPPVLQDYILKKDDVLVAMTEQAPGLLGSTLLVPEDEIYLHNQRLGLLEFIHENKVNPKYVYHYFNCLPFRRKIASSSSGTKVKHTSPSKIQDIEIFLPPIAEQKKIAEILGTCDRQIELTEKLINAKRKLKQGLMQKILKNPFWNKSENSDKFLIKDWQLVPLSKCFFERKETSSDISEYPLYSLTIEQGLTEKTDRYNREFLLKNKEENEYRVVYPEDFLYNPMNLRFGAIARSNLDFAVAVSAYYNVLIPNLQIINTQFLLDFLKSPRMMYLYNAIGKGSLVEKKRVHLSDFWRVKIPIPSLEYQNKLSNLLSLLDEEEKKLLDILNFYQSQKKGLMQQLLTGKIRVNITP